MVEFKATADAWIKEHLGITVEHFRVEKSFEYYFYSINQKDNTMYGFPNRMCNWCNARLKVGALEKAKHSIGSNAMSFIGIAFDEKERLERLRKNKNQVSPLEAVQWTEADAMKWCIANGLRSPIYDDVARGGCWFCYNATVNELRKLRHKYPQLWGLLQKWDADAEEKTRERIAAGHSAPNVFKARNGSDKVGSRVADFEKRFQLEDSGCISPKDRFKWSYLENPPQRQMTFDDIL